MVRNQVALKEGLSSTKFGLEQPTPSDYGRPWPGVKVPGRSRVYIMYIPTTKGQEMNKKWCLLKASDIGPMGRGQSGKKKVYEIIVTDSTLRCEWGMAEKIKRQSSVQVYYSPQAALAAAYEKLYAKQDRGYTIAYAA